MLEYPGLAIVGKLDTDGGMLPCFLLVMFLHLPLAICLSLVLASFAVSDGGLSVLKAPLSMLLEDLFCVHRYIGTPVRSILLWLFWGMYLCGHDQFWVWAEISRLLSQAALRLLCPQGFRLLPLSSRGGPTCVDCPLWTLEW